MADSDEKQFEKILCGYLSRQRQVKERAGCPDEESLDVHLSGNLTEETKRRLEVHLADCPFCVDELVAVHKAMQEADTETVPRQLREKAMALVFSPAAGRSQPSSI